MTAWSHLPNAAHIDRVIQSVKSHPEVWDAILDETWYATQDAAWEAAYDAVWDAARDAAWNAAYDAVWDAALEAARNAARYAAWNAILALIADDAAAKYLNLSSDKLRVWAILSEDPAAVLLLSAVIAYERISELETV